MRPSRILRTLLERESLISLPTCLDPLSARMAEEAGFETLYLGGYALGSTSCVTEPLGTMTELVEYARQIVSRVRSPLVVDAGAGFGEPLHTMRTVTELITAGVSGAHIEDQHYPKRALYHRDYHETVIPWVDMANKFRAAVQVRNDLDPDFVLIGRTDAMRTHGYAEGVRRANALLELGADLVMVFPNNLEEVMRTPAEIRGPVAYVNSAGNRVGRPVVAARDLQSAGYRMVIDAIGSTLAYVQAMRAAFDHLHNSGVTIVPQDAAIGLREWVEELVGLPDHYAVEEATIQHDEVDAEDS